MDNDFINNESNEDLRKNTNLCDMIYEEIHDFLSNAIEYCEPSKLTLEMTSQIYDVLVRGANVFYENNKPKYLYGIPINIINKNCNQIDIRMDGKLIWLRVY